MADSDSIPLIELPPRAYQGGRQRQLDHYIETHWGSQRRMREREVAQARRKWVIAVAVAVVVVFAGVTTGLLVKLFV